MTIETAPFQSSNGQANLLLTLLRPPWQILSSLTADSFVMTTNKVSLHRILDDS